MLITRNILADILRPTPISQCNQAGRGMTCYIFTSGVACICTARCIPRLPTKAFEFLLIQDVFQNLLGINLGIIFYPTFWTKIRQIFLIVGKGITNQNHGIRATLCLILRSQAAGQRIIPIVNHWEAISRSWINTKCTLSSLVICRHSFITQITLSGIEQLGWGIKAFIAATITKFIDIVDGTAIGYISFAGIFWVWIYNQHPRAFVPLLTISDAIFALCAIQIFHTGTQHPATHIIGSGQLIAEHGETGRAAIRSITTTILLHQAFRFVMAPICMTSARQACYTTGTSRITYLHHNGQPIAGNIRFAARGVSSFLHNGTHGWRRCIDINCASILINHFVGSNKTNGRNVETFV